MRDLAVATFPRPAPLIGDPGIVRRFLSAMQRAPAEVRAEAVSALARAYLHSNLDDAVRADAIVALTGVLDDPSALVRRALAEALASAAAAPRHIVLALASDQSDVARIVLARSPALTDAELVDCAAIGDGEAQSAIARRPRVSAGVAAAIAEIGERPAVLALAGNLEAELGPNVLRRIFDRFGGDAETRETLLSRPNLPADFCAELAAATARALADLAASRNWLKPQRAERIAREAREQAFVAIARSHSPDELAGLVGWLRRNKALTVALLMRALLSGDAGVFRQSLVDLSGLPERRVAGFLNHWRGQGFAALYARAGLPERFLPAFRAALDGLATGPAPNGAAISHALTTRLIRACERVADPSLAPIVAMLWRFACESARADAREFTEDAAFAAPLPLMQSFEPEDAVDHAPPIAVIEIEGVNENFAPAVELDGEARENFADAA